MNIKKITLGFLEVELEEDKIIIKSGDNKILIYKNLAIETDINGVKNIYFGSSEVILTKNSIAANSNDISIKKEELEN